MNFFIESAYAETAAQQAPAPSPWINLVLLGGMVVIFYFLLWRPQSKRQKEHQSLMASLEKGNEVITTGGILGKITKISGDYVTIEISNNVSINVQKGAVTHVLPKNTIKSI
jgi:preprotein translocase subunit YajC